MSQAKRTLPEFLLISMQDPDNKEPTERKNYKNKTKKNTHKTNLKEKYEEQLFNERKHIYRKR